MIRARSAIVIAGILLPYAARLPGALTKGYDWLLSYLDVGIAGILLFGAFNAICWGSILAATYTYHKPHSAWFPSIIGFSFPAVMHTSLDLSSDAQAALGLIIIPVFSLPLVLIGWLIGLWFDRRSAKG